MVIIWSEYFNINDKNFEKYIEGLSRALLKLLNHRPDLQEMMLFLYGMSKILLQIIQSLPEKIEKL